MSDVGSKPSSSELPILKALWQTHPMSAKEVHHCIAEKSQWSLSSTRRTLDRMVDKGFISVDSDSGVRTFSPRLNKIRTLAVFIKDFTGRVLELKKAPPISMFVDSNLLNDAELKELEALLEEEGMK